ncbi:MAG: homoserine dehydrogenase, partial [Clostridia bacterium]|nr:homoserine dehydrogenase [Clostridia bacterium]
ELMGGVNPAYDFVKKCLLAGKSVVTSNKELVAAKGAELVKIASDNNVNFLFEASVGGGIPVLHPITECMCANEIDEIWGILNGTTNYILNKMIVDNMDFDTALKLAQDLGFAEKDPTADIEGHDACRKVCILAALSFGKHVYPNQVVTKGITQITLRDVAYANEFGCVIKLIGHAKKLPNGKITASVAPTLVSRDCILSGVNGVFNAVMLNGDQTGEVVFYGKGAGKEATASAVVADIMDCIKHIDNRKNLYWVDGDNDYVDTAYDPEGRLFVLIKSDDFDGLVSQFEVIFGKDIKAVKCESLGEIAFVTEKEALTKIQEKLSLFKNGISIKTLNTML